MTSFEVSTRSQLHAVVADWWDLSANEAWFDFFGDGDDVIFRIKADDVRWIKKLSGSEPVASID
jgi:hypothetical protein